MTIGAGARRRASAERRDRRAQGGAGAKGASVDAGGRFSFTDLQGRALRDGACRVELTAERLVVLPDGGAPFSCDLGEIDDFQLTDYDLRLGLLGGWRFVFGQMGRALPGFALALRNQWRDRLARCLLVEEEKELGRFDVVVRRDGDGALAEGPAQIRVYASHLAVLPPGPGAFVVPLAGLRALRFDDASYAVELEDARGRTTISHMARETANVRRLLREATEDRARLGAHVVEMLFPFLDPPTIAKVAAAVPETRLAALQDLARIDPRLPTALSDRAVSPERKAYYGALAVQATGRTFASYKFVPAADLEDDGGAAEAAEDEATGSVAEWDPGYETTRPATRDEAVLAPLFSFFFPLVSPGRGLTLAWEATSASARATYLFAADPADRDVPEAAAERLNAALARIGYRREPIYVSDEQLERDPRFAHYAVGIKRAPELAWLRARFVGRAVHTTTDVWGAQMQRLLG